MKQCDSPPHQQSAPGYPGSESRHQNQVTTLDASRTNALIQADGDGGRGSISDAADVRIDLFRADAQPSPHGLGNALIGLVGNEEIELVGADFCLLHDAPRDLFQAADSDLEEFVATHLDVVVPRADGLAAGRFDRPAGGNIEMVGVSAVVCISAARIPEGVAAGPN